MRARAPVTRLIRIDTNTSTEVNFLLSIAEGDPTIRPVFADWLEEHGDDLRAEYVRAQCDLLAATELSTFDELARRLAILAIGLDRHWIEQLECPAIRERFVNRRLGWLSFSFSSSLASKGWELPEQLRYLEKLTPRTPPVPMAMEPRGGWR